MAKLIVPFDHDPADHSAIYLAAQDIAAPATQHLDWQPAYRDTIDGQKVVWIRLERSGFINAWLRTRNGITSLGRVSLTA